MNDIEQQVQEWAKQYMEECKANAELYAEMGQVSLEDDADAERMVFEKAKETLVINDRIAKEAISRGERDIVAEAQVDKVRLYFAKRAEGLRESMLETTDKNLVVQIVHAEGSDGKNDD